MCVLFTLVPEQSINGDIIGMTVMGRNKYPDSPQALLQAQGIMPASVPQPQASPARAIKPEKRRANASGDASSRPAKRPKAEPGTSAAKVDLGVINISDDDDDDGDDLGALQVSPTTVP